MIKPHRRLYIEYKWTPVILYDTWTSTGFGVCGNSGTNFSVQRATKGYLSIIIEQMWRNLLEELAHATTEAEKLQTGCLRTREASHWWISQSETDMPESSRNLLGRPNPDLTSQGSKITVEKVWGRGKRIFPSPTCWFEPCQSDGAGLLRVGICLLSISVPVPSSGKTSTRHGGILHVQSLDFEVSSGRSLVLLWCLSLHTAARIAESRLCKVCWGDWGVNSLYPPSLALPNSVTSPVSFLNF